MASKAMLPFPVGFFYTSLNSFGQMAHLAELLPAFLRKN